MQERHLWAALVFVIGAGVIGWNVVVPLSEGTKLAHTAPPSDVALPKTLPRSLIAPANEDSDTPLDVQIDRLIASHDPAKAYEAYWLLANCERFNREHDRLIFDQEEVKQHRNLMPYRGMTEAEKKHDAKLCGGMTERMRTSRIDYLAIAVKAGVRGALIQMADEGPYGDRNALTTRPDDPMVKEWKANVLEQLRKDADGGDLATLNYLWMRSLSGDALIDKDPALAYRYAVARGFIDAELNGPNATEATMYAPEGQLMMSIVDLSAEQRNAERAAAQRIADNARERRRRELAASR